jgi:hypothetical protein
MDKATIIFLGMCNLALLIVNLVVTVQIYEFVHVLENM